MSRPDPGWDWFAGPDTAEAAQAPSRASEVPDEQTVLKAFARCFSEREGEIVLAYLRAHTLDRPLGPQATDAALRHLEGQRHLVAHIASLIERGRRGA